MNGIGIPLSWIPRLMAIAIPGIFLILIVFWSSAAVIINYHWRHYGPNPVIARRFHVWFYGASLVCIAMAAASLIGYFS